MKHQMSKFNFENRIAGTTVTDPGESAINDGFGETDSLEIEPPSGYGHYNRRVQLRSDMAKACWTMTACLYVALIGFAVLITWH